MMSQDPNVTWTLVPVSILTQTPNHLKKLDVKRLFLQNLSLPDVDFYKQGHCELPSILKKNKGHICKIKTYYSTKSSLRLKLWNIKNTLMIFSSMFQPTSIGSFCRVSNTSQEHFLHVISLPFDSSALFPFWRKEHLHGPFSCSPKSYLTQLQGSLTQVKLQPNTLSSGRATGIPALLMITFSSYYTIWMTLELWMSAQSSGQHLLSNTVLWPSFPTSLGPAYSWLSDFFSLTHRDIFSIYALFSLCSQAKCWVGEKEMILAIKIKRSSVFDSILHCRRWIPLAQFYI